jgi:Flp pilus assembly protein TadB
MVIPIMVFFGSILFGFALLYFAIQFWKRKRNERNTRKFSQSYTSTSVTSMDNEIDSEIEDYSLIFLAQMKMYLILHGATQ